MMGTPWTEEDDATLRRMWFDEITCSTIGRALGRSKNAIVGRVGRLGLPRRRSPLLPRGVDAPPKPVAPRETFIPAPIVDAPQPVFTAPDPVVSYRIEPETPGRACCQWLSGHSPVFRQCTAEAVRAPSGVKSWCLDHLRIVYRPWYRDAPG